MEKGRIAGGILVAVGVVAQITTQAMGLKVPQPIGIAVLAVCLVAAVLGVALIFAPSTAERIAREAETRRDADSARAAENDRRIKVAKLVINHLNDEEMAQRGLSPKRASGMELPPESDLNKQLASMGENFTIAVRGHQFWVSDRATP